MHDASDGMGWDDDLLCRFGGWKFWCYSQLEYITAAMLSRYVPRGTCLRHCLH